MDKKTLKLSGKMRVIPIGPAKRELTSDEQEFVREAHAGAFDVLYEDDGTPYAMGAPKTGNLFKVPVVEIEDGADQSIYVLTT